MIECRQIDKNNFKTNAMSGNDVIAAMFRRFPTCSHKLLVKLKNAQYADHHTTLLHTSTTQYRL